MTISILQNITSDNTFTQLSITFLFSLITIFHHSNFVQNGNTALHQACKGCHTDTVYCLLSHGADQTVKNNEGKTSLDEASNDEIVNLLTKHNPKRGIFTDHLYINY